MSRIDQALERARLAHPEAVPEGVAPHGAPAEAVFTQPWELDTTPAAPERPSVDAVVHRPRLVAPPPPAIGLRINPDLVEKTVLGEGTSRVAIEQYRRLTSNLHQAQLDRGIKRLMVISALAAEGKSLTSLNLALTLSRSHRRNTLLIDADLRRPSLHTALCVPGNPGLREAVAEGNGEPPPIHRFGDHLSLLTGGTPTNDPIQVLSSARAREIIARASEEFDWVVIDTPPLAVLPDANVLADLVDGAILVISAGRTPYDLVSNAVKLLGPERILGVVLNGVEVEDLGAAGYYDSYTHYSGI